MPIEKGMGLGGKKALADIAVGQEGRDVQWDPGVLRRVVLDQAHQSRTKSHENYNWELVSVRREERK